MRVNEYYYELISLINDIIYIDKYNSNINNLLINFLPYIGDDDIKNKLIISNKNIEYQFNRENIDTDEIKKEILNIKSVLFEKIIK
jgi:hypothetical protein